MCEYYEYIESCSGLTENPEIVASLKASAIKKIVKAYNPLVYSNLIRSIPHIPTEDVFNTLWGTVLLYLENNDVIGFDVHQVKDSIISWYDTHQGEKFDTEYHVRELSDYMPYDHSIYSPADNWEYIIGNRITKISVIEHDIGSQPYYLLDSFQSGIILETTSGDNMVLSMLPGLGPFQLITKAQIPEELWDVVNIIEL